MGVLQSRMQPTPQTTEVAAGSDRMAFKDVQPESVKTLSPSPISDHMDIPSEPTRWDAPYVNHGQNTRGMRYLYARGTDAIPLQALGAGGNKRMGMAVWNSEFQPDRLGLHDAGFNDRLFQAGYPGFNLMLSFKVQTNPSADSSRAGPGTTTMSRIPQQRSAVITFGRGLGRLISPGSPGQGVTGGKSS
jgi:hypothetical protein